MKKQSLRVSTLLSLIGLSTSQTTTTSRSSWGEPFSVAGPSVTASTESLIASSALASSTNSVVESQMSEIASSESLATDAGATGIMRTQVDASTGVSSFTVTLPSTSQPALTVSTPIIPAVNGTGVSSSSGTGSTTTSATESVPESQSTGAAPTPYVRMGVVGVLAGAAGVFMV